MDYNFVTNRIATGAAVSSQSDVEQLINDKITMVIDCRAEYDDIALLASHPEITYIYAGTADDGLPKEVDWFSKPIESALSELSKPRTKILTHCAAGINRGPSMCYALLLAQGLDINLAENIIRKARPQVGLAYKNDGIRAVTALGYMDTPQGSAFGDIEK